MKKSALIACISSLLICVFTLSCNNSVDDMLDDYNGQFKWSYITIKDKQEEEEPILSPGDEGFDPEDMLREVYALQYDSTLNLAGPPKNVYTYEWTLEDPKKNYAIVDVITMNNRLDTQYFVIYVPDSGLETDHTYKLTLKIITQGGVFYKDSCSVVIYPHYIYD